MRLYVATELDGVEEVLGGLYVYWKHPAGALGQSEEEGVPFTLAISLRYVPSFSVTLVIYTVSTGPWKISGHRHGSR